ARRIDVPETVSAETNGEEPGDDPDALWVAGAVGRHGRGAPGRRIPKDGVVEEVRPCHERTRHPCEQRVSDDLVLKHRSVMDGIGLVLRRIVLHYSWCR